MAELLWLFLKLGCIGFGGPQAHIAMMEDECVQRRRWVTPERFAQGLALCNLLPGPASTQLAIWLGYERRRWLGAIAAGVLFILPAFVMVVAIASVYVRYGTVPAARHLLFGVKPAVVAIVLATCWRLWKPIDGKRVAAAFLVTSTILTLAFPASVAFVLVAAGIVGAVVFTKRAKAAAVHMWHLFLYFFKTGALIFGGGLVLVPLLQGDIVTRNGWLTTRQFLDAVAVGQLTPGPVVITSAFIGYLLGGIKGAAVAAAGMFTPSFLMVLAAAPILERARANDRVKAALKGLMPAVIGAILAASVPLAGACVAPTVAGNVIAVALMTGALVSTVKFKANAGLVVLLSGLVGLVSGAFGAL
jgi:chromate transporter